MVRDNVRWAVREIDSRHVPGSRRDSCLIFECDGIVRRLWEYPDAWVELADDDLWALIEAPVPVTISVELQATLVAERTRSLLTQVAVLRDADRILRDDQHALLERCSELRRCMHTAIIEYAGTLRARGIPPERALVLLKSALQRGVAGCDDAMDLAAEQLLHEGVDRAIDAYYAA